MDKEALLKTILCLVGFLAYLTLVVIACATESMVLIGLVLGPVVIIGIGLIGKELYELFKD